MLRAPTWRFCYALRLEIVVSPCAIAGCTNHGAQRFHLELAALTQSIALATAAGQPLSGVWS